SYETLRIIRLELGPLTGIAAQHGKAFAENKYAPRTGRVDATAPLERVEVDNFLIDVHVICPFTGARLARAWVTLLLDRNTGCILGYHITFGAPCAESVLSALRHAILPKPAEGLHRSL